MKGFIIGTKCVHMQKSYDHTQYVYILYISFYMYIYLYIYNMSVISYVICLCPTYWSSWSHSGWQSRMQRASQRNASGACLPKKLTLFVPVYVTHCLLPVYHCTMGRRAIDCGAGHPVITGSSHHCLRGN